MLDLKKFLIFFFFFGGFLVLFFILLFLLLFLKNLIVFWCVFDLKCLWVCMILEKERIVVLFIIFLIFVDFDFNEVWWEFFFIVYFWYGIYNLYWNWFFLCWENCGNMLLGKVCLILFFVKFLIFIGGNVVVRNVLYCVFELLYVLFESLCIFYFLIFVLLGIKYIWVR